MNKQELIKNIKSLAREASQHWPHEEMVELPDVLRGINQLDEPEVLSQEWIRNNQERKGVHFFVNVTKLQSLLVPKQEELETKINELIESYKQEENAYSNPENGWISGFIEDLNNLVEKEQKYYIIDEEDNILLIRGYGGIEKADNLKITDSGGGALKLTEQEIKDFDPRYWAFRKPVDE